MLFIITVCRQIVKQDQHLSTLTEGLSRCASSDPMPLRGLRWKWSNASPYGHSDAHQTA